jgi:hypothetical protein
MLAPHFSFVVCSQSDFGLPAGAVLPTRSFRTFPQNLACGAGAAPARGVQRLLLRQSLTD